MENNLIKLIPYKIRFTDVQGVRDIFFLEHNDIIYPYYSTTGENSGLPEGTLVPFDGFYCTGKYRIKKSRAFECFNFGGRIDKGTLALYLQETNMNEEEEALYRVLLDKINAACGDQYFGGIPYITGMFLRLGSIPELCIGYLLNQENFLNSEDDNVEDLRDILNKNFFENSEYNHILGRYIGEVDLSEAQEVLSFTRGSEISASFKKGVMLTNIFTEWLREGDLDGYEAPEELKNIKKQFLECLGDRDELDQKNLESIVKAFQTGDKIITDEIIIDDYFPEYEIKEPMKKLFEEIVNINASNKKKKSLENSFNKLNDKLREIDLSTPHSKYYIYSGQIPESMMDEYFSIKVKLNELKS